MKKTDQHSLCPCGSGKPFEHCCGRQAPPAGSANGSDPGAEFRAALAAQQFATMADMERFAEHLMHERNQAAHADFQGLSPQQMHRFLHYPFASPGLVDFPQCLDATPAAPIMTTFMHLATGIAEQHLKPTAKGNLPRNFCRGTALAVLGEEGYQQATRHGNINREEDYTDLHLTRVLSELAGLVRKYKGRFILSRDCRKLLDDRGPAAIYPRLLHSYTAKFNWAYIDRFAPLYLIQQSFLFTLYLLSRYGNSERPATFYEDAFMRAFPTLVDEIGPTIYDTPELRLRACYTRRALACFTTFLGLARVEARGAVGKQTYYVTKLPLLDAAVHFHV